MDRSFIIALATLVLAQLLIRPTADIPINDDWQYSAITQRLATTSQLKIDLDIAPALVTQAWLGAIWSKLVGFSHLHLRILTWIVGILMILFFNLLLKNLGILSTMRTLSLLTLIFNPLFLHTFNSFMTEIYGYTLMLLGILVWQKNSLMMRILASFLLGTSFTIRQFCALAWPALMLATYFPLRREILKHAQQIFIHSVSFVLPIAAFFVWTRSTHNVTEAFSSPASMLLRFDLVPLFFQIPVAFLYLTFFSLPLMVASLSWGPIPFRRLIGFALWMFGALLYLFIQGKVGHTPHEALHRFFPYLGNIVSPIGLGPVSITDAYLEGSLSHTGELVWALFGGFMAVVTVVWASGFQFGRSPLERFSMVFIALSLYIVIMAFRKDVFDRYHFGILLAFLLTLSMQAKPLGACKFIAYGAAGILGLFSAAGTFDYFRWQEARWELVKQAERRGITSIDGGYEVNGWRYANGQTTDDCSFTAHFFCPQRLFAIIARPGPNDRILITKHPKQILFQMTELHLIERRT